MLLRAPFQYTSVLLILKHGIITCLGGKSHDRYKQHVQSANATVNRYSHCKQHDPLCMRGSFLVKSTDTELFSPDFVTDTIFGTGLL